MADAGRLKQVNTALLRKVMRGDTVYSKNELARQTGLSFPTVSRIIDELTETGEVRTMGAAASTGGRCAMQYALDVTFRLFLCMRLEGKTLQWFICDMRGRKLEQEQLVCTNDMVNDIDTLLMRVKARYPRLAAVSLGFAGMMRDGQVTEAFGCPELRGVSLNAHLKDKAGVPAAVVRDMHIVAKGYAARCSVLPRAVVCIYLGHSGIGAGMVLGKDIWIGAHEFAGELHYLPIKNNLEYAKTHFAGADITAYYMQVIRAYAALLDPDRIVLYDNRLLAGKVDRIRQACVRTLPPQAAPEIELSKEMAKDYEAGLIAVARELIEEDL